MTTLRLRYQTIELDDIDIHLCTLRNLQEYSDPGGVAEAAGISSATWPLFGVVWPSSLVLAHFMLHRDTTSRRILEIGCGMALTSLLLNKRQDDITATDCHPEAQRFLNRNTLLNGDTEIAFERADWSGLSDTLGRFDLIIGSDLLYEDAHTKLLADFIQRHARPLCEVIIVDPGRGRQGKLITQMSAHGFVATQLEPAPTDYLEHAFKGKILRFLRGAI